MEKAELLSLFKKIYVLDTNVLIHNPDVIDDLGDNIVIIPFCVLEELDNLKGDLRVGVAVREVSRIIERYRRTGQETGTFLDKGISTDSGGLLIIEHNGHDFSLLKVEIEDKVDNRIMLVALNRQKTEKNANTGRQVILLSNDINVRIKASANEVMAEEWKKDRLVNRVQDIYTGVLDYLLPEEMNDLMSRLPTENFVNALDYLPQDLISSFYPNQCVRIWANNGRGKVSVFAIYKKENNSLIWAKKPYKKDGDFRKFIKPINDEQNFAYQLCMDQQTTMVTLMGAAGTGKTLMALLAGYDQVKKGLYKKILVWRPNVTLGGKELGFLPGDLEEKFAPWARPILDAYAKIAGDSGEVMSQHMNDKPKEQLLFIEPILFVKGSTVDNAYIIVDEVQDMTPREVKACLTRAGFGTKIVLTGDVEQIENRFLDEINNGLTYTIQRMRESKFSGHVTLTKSERSDFVHEVVNRM